MKSGRVYLTSAFLVLAIAFLGMMVVNFVTADPVGTDANAVTSPANGTASSLNITFPAQEWTGFFGNATWIIRKSGGQNGTSLLNRTALGGCVFVNKAGAAPTWPQAQSAPDANADGNFSLSGAYVTKNVFENPLNLCGIAGTFTVNTTDNYAVGIYRDNNGSSAKHFLGANIAPKSSTNGFGPISYQIIVPRGGTGAYAAGGLDFYVELS